MHKYRKKPVVIDAFQMTFARRRDNRDWPDWLNQAWNKSHNEPGALFPIDFPDSNGEDELVIYTLEGLHRVTFGDYIIRGVKGEIYACKPDIFVETYDWHNEAADEANEPYLLEASVNELVSICHGDSAKAGWWTHQASGLDLRGVVRGEYPGPTYSLMGGALVAQKLALIHSEVSEAMEAHRKGLMDDKLPHRKGIEVELADAVIRIADLAGALKLDLGGAIAEKREFNRFRPDHKPEARAAAGGKAY